MFTSTHEGRRHLSRSAFCTAVSTLRCGGGMAFHGRYIYIYVWVNYNDLTATSLESWLVRGIIPKWPNYSG